MIVQIGGRGQRRKKSIHERVNWWFASHQARVGPREAQVRKAIRATIGQLAWGATVKTRQPMVMQCEASRAGS